MYSLRPFGLVAALASAPALGQPLAQAIAPAAAAERLGAVRQQEESVRQAPLMSRPNRAGHFYGNNVRRLRHGTICVNCQRSDRPLARFFYLPD